MSWFFALRRCSFLIIISFNFPYVTNEGRSLKRKKYKKERGQVWGKNGWSLPVGFKN